MYSSNVTTRVYGKPSYHIAFQSGVDGEVVVAKTLPEYIVDMCMVSTSKVKRTLYGRKAKRATNCFLIYTAIVHDPVRTVVKAWFDNNHIIRVFIIDAKEEIVNEIRR